VLDGNVLAPLAIQDADSGIIIPGTDKEAADNEVVKDQESTGKSKFPWILLLVLLIIALIAALLYFLSKHRRSAVADAPSEPDSTAPIAPPGETKANLEEEIRRRAYELYLQRSGQNGDADGDWYAAVSEICARYKALGFKVNPEDGCWWACLTTKT
jgi:hypothetical protein